MNDSIKLKPCPFCGSKVRVGIGVANSYFIVHTDWQKSKCPIRFTNVIPDADTPEKAAEAWNRRAEQTDTKPIKTGEWLEDEYAYFRCSECGYEQDQPETVTPYCPGCGAHMEDESEVTED